MNLCEILLYDNKYKRLDMYKRIIPSMFYSINMDTNEVNRLSGRETPELKQTEDSVYIKLYDKKRVVKKEWLKWLVYYNITLPTHLENEIWNVRFYEHKLKSRVKITDKKMVVFKNPVYVDENKEFRLLARYPDYAISIDGRLMEVNRNKIVTYDTSNDLDYRYPTVRIFDRPLGRTTLIKIHRLVALAWCVNKDFISRPIVNHKDRNRHNFHASNLEWISYSGNATHVLDGEINYNITYKIRNIDTGEVINTESLTSAAKLMGRSRINTVAEPLRKDKVWVTPIGNYEIKTSIDKTPWYYTKERMLSNTNRLVHIYKLRFKGGTSEVFRSTADIYKKFFNKTRHIGYDELRKKLLGTNGISHFYREKIGNRDKLGYQALNIKTMEVFTADSQDELAKLTGLGRSTITKAININDANRVYCDFLIRNFSNEPWDTSNLTFASNKPTTYNIFKDGVLIETINSTRELCLKYNLERHFIMYHFKNNETLTTGIFIIKRLL